MIGNIKQEIIELIEIFCDKYLNDEYKQLCAKLMQKLSRKHNVPFLRGRIEIWAASVIIAIGKINFLFDKSSGFNVSRDNIADFFGVSKSTISQKATAIINMLKLGYWDAEFSTENMRNKKPSFLNWFSYNRIF